MSGNLELTHLGHDWRAARPERGCWVGHGERDSDEAKHQLTGMKKCTEKRQWVKWKFQLPEF